VKTTTRRRYLATMYVESVRLSGRCLTEIWAAFEAGFEAAEKASGKQKRGRKS